MAVFETLFMLAGFFMGFVSQGGMFLFLLPLAVVAFVLAIMNRPSPTGSRARKIVSSILSVAYLVTVIVCSLTFFKGGSNDSVDVPPRNALVAALHKLHNGTELGLHECTVAISGEIRMSPAKGGFYVCKDTSWQVIDPDTYGVLCNEQSKGSKTKGQVDSSKEYYCTGERWVDMKYWNWDVPKEERFNPKINYGTLTDARDGHKYKTVQIGNQTWMAENLNYIDTLKMDCSKIDDYWWCYKATCLDRQNKTCDVTGAFYTWAAAVDSARLVSESVNPEKCCFCGAKCSVPAQVQGICPDGWHLPSDGEWKTLFVSVGGTDFAGQALKARSGWGEENDHDAFGFSALPTGLVHMEHVLLDGTAFFWSVSDSNCYYAHSVMVSPKASPVTILKETEKLDYLPVRCVKDDSIKVPASGVAAKPKSGNGSPSSKVTRGFVKDARDGQTYKTVKIGDQTWMAKNLNYQYNKGTAKSYCYGNSADSCAKYGRLYTWAAAIDSVQIYKDSKEQCGDGKRCKLPKKVRGVCPSGWHLPTLAEWDVLIATAGCPCNAGKALKARSGWDKLNGTDDYGFSALPGGMRYGDDYPDEKTVLEGSFMDAGHQAVFWSATETFDEEFAGWMVIDAYADNASTLESYRKRSAFSVRCVKD